MKDFLLLSWFYSNNDFKALIISLCKNKEPCSELRRLWILHKDEIVRIKKELKEKNIFLVTYFDEGYPESLKHLDSPPWVLCFKGDMSVLKSKTKLAIVGSRRPDPDALYWLNSSIRGLEKETVVVSGGAIGLDQFAHKVSARVGLKGICVLPVGIFQIYPKSLNSLLIDLFKAGKFLVVSQFHPYKRVSKSAFYPRNYVLAGLSDKVLVVQAALKSGTMVTAKYAADLGKDVYTLPASPWDQRYEGNLKLLEDGAVQITDFRWVHL